MNKLNRIMVKGKPFLSLGGQTHNSSSYIPEKMDESFAAIKAVGANTMATPIPWNAFEPEEGKFDRELVTKIIDRARLEGIKLAFLWFASWKNGTMEYAPAWVKRDTKRFQRCLLKDGTEIHQLSAHVEANWEADKKAFVELCRIIRDYDEEEQTVVAIQIENEPGILGGTRRDFSPAGEAEFLAPVPAEIIDYAKANPDCYLGKKWAKYGKKEGAGWADTFGYYGAEAMTARAIALYVDRIAKAGKELLPRVFMYVNVWLSGGKRGTINNVAGLGWPSGCPTVENVDIYYATVKYIDTIAPDNYNAVPVRHKEVTERYANPDRGFPLYVPESGARGVNLKQMFYALAEKKGIGYHYFGIESVLSPAGTLTASGELGMHNFTMLKNIAPILFEYQDKNAVRSAVQEEFEDAVVIDDLEEDRILKISFGRNDGLWEGSDFRHRRIKPEDKDQGGGRALIFRESEKVYYFVGESARVTFEDLSPLDGSVSAYLWNLTMAQSNAEYVSLTEGHFDEDGVYTVDRVRSGDEARHGIWLSWDVGVVRVELK